LVISGTSAGVERATQLLQEAGAKKVVSLKVSGGFHSSLMESARQPLQLMIESCSFKKPSCPIYQNVTASPTLDPAVIKKNLVNQLTMPVLWKQTIERMVQDGVTSFIECGPGAVLQGLVRRINPNVHVDRLG
jgi:[acyl-carrier-protein] S-malonyltransferase